MFFDAVHLVQKIDSILATTERFNPQSISALEEYASQQLKDNNYDRTACLALLKLYQMNPTYTNIESVWSVLALALGAMPEADFTLCLFLLRDEQMQDPLVVHFTNLHALLEQARFVEFWAYMENEESVREFTNDYAMFEENIREFVANTLSITFQTIAVDTLGAMLDLSGEDLGDWIKLREGWEINADDEELIDLPIGPLNQAVSLVVNEDIKFDKVTKILARSRIVQ
eukprot:jgi/Hompol1/4370/HPOL_003511-RA